MAIVLEKTLQQVLYTLYIKTEVQLSEENKKIYLIQDMYTSKGHFTDGFLPIIRKRLDTGNVNIIRVVKALIEEDRSSAILAIETFLVQNVAYYTGGVVENGIS
jgi:hypothetical protein